MEKALIVEQNKSKTISKYNLSHLTQASQYVFGPIQDDEALLLYGLFKTLRPKTVVEFGFSHGVSSTNFLQALDSDAKLYSYDINLYNPNADPFKDPRFKFYLKSQTEFLPSDTENRLIDVAYFDDGHIFNVNTVAFQKTVKYMSPVGVIVVHDTGLHAYDSFKIHTCACDFPKYCGGVHQSDERSFINWIMANYPEWQVVELHSFNIFRHGLSILQKKFNLSISPVDPANCKYV